MFTFRDVWSVAHTAMRSLYLPDGFTVYSDTLIRFIFSIYYLPFIMLALAITHSAIERIVWVLIVPVAQDMEMQPYNSSHLVTFLLGISNIVLRILPFSTLGFSVAMLGHKVLNCFVEAMMDACSSSEGKNFPLLSSRLRFVLNNRRRYYTFYVVLPLLVSVVLSCLHTNIFISWENRDFTVVFAAWTIITVETIFVFLTIFWCKPKHLCLLEFLKKLVGDIQTFSSFFCDEWWVSYVHYMRHISIGSLLIFALLSLLSHGPLYVLSSTVELLLYLNIPHIVGHVVLSISTSTIRVQQSFRWLMRHSEACLPVFILLFTYQSMLLYAMYYFSHHWLTVGLFVLVSVSLITRTIDLVREFDVTKEGSVHWKGVADENKEIDNENKSEEGKLLPPYISLVLEEAYEENLSHVAVVRLDLSMDLAKMKLYDTKTETKIERTQVFTRSSAWDYLHKSEFYTYTFPRLLSVRSPGYFGSRAFCIARLVFRGITISCLIIYAILVCGLLFQSAFPQLRPWPVYAHTTDDNNSLTIDHILVRMHLLSNKAAGFLPNSSYNTAAGMASDVFKWNNVTSTNEDWYPSLCKRTFHGISIWEVSLLALLPYLFNDESVSKVLQFMSNHMGSDWIVRKRHGSDCISHDSSNEPTGWTGYIDFYSVKHDVSVIALRGTDMTSFFDLLTDINIFFDVVLYHLLTNIVPGATIIPSDLIADLLRVASVPAATKRRADKWSTLVRSRNTSLRACQYNNFRRDFFADVYNHLAYAGSRARPPRHVLLTGHSLGGAVAAIVGAQMGVEAVGFSAPGIALSRKRFEYERVDINKYVVRVMCSHDIFPKIGGAGGEEHHVECLAKPRELCHAMEFLVGTLWRSCGSIRARYPSIASVE